MFAASPLVNLFKDRLNKNTVHTKATLWDDESVFDKDKEKNVFRQYDEACDGVREFYREQHGTRFLRILSYLVAGLTPAHFDGR